MESALSSKAGSEGANENSILLSLALRAVLLPESLTLKVKRYGSRTNGHKRCPRYVITRGMIAVMLVTRYWIGTRDVVDTTVPA